MKSIDLQLQVPQLKNPDDAKQLASMVAKLQEILQFIVDNLQMAQVKSSAPTAKQMLELGDNAGNLYSSIIVEHNATAGLRKIHYLYQGTVYTITGA